MSITYVVAGAKPWNRWVFDEVIINYPGKWHFITAPEQLTSELLSNIAPRYIFFLHWSWKVPTQIVQDYECVCFHMTDVPYGRGGSPLQNLIRNGHQNTKLTALRMVEDFDAGPVYLKKDLCLMGNAEEIYIRTSYLSAEIIRHIVDNEPAPQPQEGDLTVFKRRLPHQSKIPNFRELQELYDFIRMLDAEGYPRAFLEYGGFRYEFSRATLYNKRIIADVKITPIAEAKP
jgi:methionyl-tRNA formyltransferase